MFPINVSAFKLPGYEPSGVFQKDVIVDASDGSVPKAPYKIPPLAWPIVFLIAAYVGLRFLLES